MNRYTRLGVLSLNILILSGTSNEIYADIGDQLFTLSASNSFNDNQFGISVAIGGTTAIVGAIGTPAFYPGAITPAHRFPGAAYVFDVTTGREIHKLTAPDGVARDEFGAAIATNGSICVIGAPKHTEQGIRSGSAYLFNVVSGEKLFEITPSQRAVFDYFGSSVAISNEFAIIGAPGYQQTGYGELFDIDTGQQLMRFTPSDGPTLAEFGRAVALGGNFAVIGAPHDSHAGRLSGSAYVFDVLTGQEVRKLTASDANPFAAFGASVSVDGNRALIGAYGEGAPGAVYLFDLTTGNELLRIPSPAGNDEQYRFGTTVALHNNLALIGAPDDDQYGINSGAVFVYDIGSGKYLAKYKAATVKAGDLLGYAVAMDGGYAIAGVAPDNEDGNIGSANMFSLVPEPSSTKLCILTVALVCFSRCLHRYSDVA